MNRFSGASNKRPIASRDKHWIMRMLPILLLFFLILSASGCRLLNIGDFSGQDDRKVTEYSIPWDMMGGKPESGEIGVTAIVDYYAGFQTAERYYDRAADSYEYKPSTWFTARLSESGAGVVPSDWNVKSAIEWNRSTYKKVTSVKDSYGNTLETLMYPVIKKLDNGDLLWFFREGEDSPSILYIRSNNG